MKGEINSNPIIVGTITTPFTHIDRSRKREKDGHYIMIKGSIQEEDITIINIYAPNTGAPQSVRQMLTSMKGEINNNTIIVGDFIPHSHLWINQLNRKLTRKHKL